MNYFQKSKLILNSRNNSKKQENLAAMMAAILFKFIVFLTLRDFIKFQGVDPNIRNVLG
jgi:hypothetical protein